MDAAPCVDVERPCAALSPPCARDDHFTKEPPTPALPPAYRGEGEEPLHPISPPSTRERGAVATIPQFPTGFSAAVLVYTRLPSVVITWE